MQYSGYMSLEVIGQWWLLPPCLLITVVQQLQELQSSISVEVVLWGCNLDDCPGPPSPTVPVLCHGLELWSPPSRLRDDSPTYACTAAADVFIIPHLAKILYRSWPSPLPRWRVFFFELFCFVCLFLVLFCAEMMNMFRSRAASILHHSKMNTTDLSSYCALGYSVFHLIIKAIPYGWQPCKSGLWCL